MASRKARSTRRRAAKGGLTVESLHRSFEAIDERVRAMIDRGASDAQLSACIEKAWLDHFGSDVSGPAVEGLLTHYRAVHPGKGGKKGRRTRKQKSQRGGSAATSPQQKGGMAPLDYTMGQGTTAPTYGSFIAEMGKTPAAMASLDTVNRFFESPISRSCNDTGGAPPPPQRGGSLWAAVTTPHAPTSVPANGLQSGLAALQGVAIGPGSSPVSATAPMIRQEMTPYDTTQIHQITQLAPLGTY